MGKALQECALLQLLSDKKVNISFGGTLKSAFFL